MREKRRVATTNRIHPYRHVERCHLPAQTHTKKRPTRRDDEKNNSNQDKTVSSAIFINERELYTCGCVDATVKLWDLRKFRDRTDAKCVLQSPTGRGFTSITANQNSGMCGFGESKMKFNIFTDEF